MVYDLIGNETEAKENFSNQIELLTRDMTDNQKEILFEIIKLIKAQLVLIKYNTIIRSEKYFIIS